MAWMALLGWVGKLFIFLVLLLLSWSSANILHNPVTMGMGAWVEDVLNRGIHDTPSQHGPWRRGGQQRMFLLLE